MRAAFVVAVALALFASTLVSGDNFVVLSSPTKLIHSLLVCDVATGKTLREKSIDVPGAWSLPLAGYNAASSSFVLGMDVESGQTGLWTWDTTSFAPGKVNQSIGAFHIVNGVLFNPNNEKQGYAFCYPIATGPSAIALCTFDITAGTMSALIPFPNENNIRGNPWYDPEHGIIYALAFVNNLNRAILRFDLSVRTFQATNLQMTRAAYIDAIAIAPPRGPWAGKTLGVLQYPSGGSGPTVVQFVWIDPINGALRNATNIMPGASIPIQTFFSHDGNAYTLFSNSTASASYVAVVPSIRPPMSFDNDDDRVLGEMPNPNAPEFTWLRTFDPPLALYPGTIRLLKR